MAINALQTHKQRQDQDRHTAGARWDDQDLVFATRTGAPLDAANVRREFRAACTAAGIGPGWTPRELRHSFVSLMSSTGVPVEEIARLAVHTSTRTTKSSTAANYDPSSPPEPKPWTRSPRQLHPSRQPRQQSTTAHADERVPPGPVTALPMVLPSRTDEFRAGAVSVFP
jgi:Phage integrase family